jgi:6-phosphogluconolactonase
MARYAMVLALMLTTGPAQAVPPRNETPIPRMWVYVGTYTDKGSKGIYRLLLDLDQGGMSHLELAAECASPSFLAIHPSQEFLYAVNEVDNFDGKHSGSVTAFTLNQATGHLTKLNHQVSGGAHPCHLVVDREGKHVLTANYTSGSAEVIALEKDGRLGAVTCNIQHQGKGADPGRQGGPHAHSVNLDTMNRFAFVADLGLDKVLVYRYNSRKGTLKANEPPAFITPPGSGPRHFAFHPNGRMAYVINELNSTVIAMAYDYEAGVLKELQTLSTLPADFKKASYPAEVQVHPSGRFLYGSNRGHDSIAIFTIDPKTGMLKAAGYQTHHIKNPRNFGIDPTGQYMIVANQDNDSLVLFRIDPMTGALTSAGGDVTVSRPVCIKMVRMEK